MGDRRKETGQYGEILAERYLVGQNYKIVAKNWRCAAGELDLVAQQHETLVFVEVRTRRGRRLGTPEESVSRVKQAKLIDLAYTFLAEHDDQQCPWRIDVIAVQLNRQGRLERLTHLESAVEG